MIDSRKLIHGFVKSRTKSSINSTSYSKTSSEDSATQGEASLAICLIQRRNPNPRVRAEAARGLRGTFRPEVVVILNELLHDPDESVRESATESLEFTRVLELLDKVQGKDANERLHALEGLGNMGGAAKWGELIISRCLNDSNEEIQRAAADALKKIRSSQTTSPR